MSFTSVPGGAPLTLNTKRIWGNPKANPRDEHTVAPAHGSSPFSRALSPIPRGGFAARSSLPCTLPLVAATSVTQERHGVMPACPQPALGLARELSVPVPCACRPPCRRKHTLLTEQSWRGTAVSLFLEEPAATQRCSEISAAS